MSRLVSANFFKICFCFPNTLEVMALDIIFISISRPACDSFFQWVQMLENVICIHLIASFRLDQLMKLGIYYF